MRNGTNGAAGDRLGEAQRRLELWRLLCRRPGRIPTDLWLLAAEAAAEHGVESTARKLRLNSERLEEWLAEWERTRRPAESDGTEFVELPPVLWATPGECRVEVEEPSGRQLRISLNGSAVGQLAILLPLLCDKEVAS